jgi:hypothetical protein
MKVKVENTEYEDTEVEAAEEKGRRGEGGKEKGNEVWIKLQRYPRFPERTINLSELQTC